MTAPGKPAVDYSALADAADACGEQIAAGLESSVRAARARNRPLLWAGFAIGFTAGAVVVGIAWAVAR